MISLRPATAADQARIQAIIREADINPMDLKWPNFVLAVDDATGEIVGTGQIKQHGDGSRELASIAVVPSYQKQGLSRRIIEHLLSTSTGTLYLTCRDVMVPLYLKFGFRRIERAEMPPYFWRLSWVAALFLTLSRSKMQMAVMKLER